MLVKALIVLILLLESRVEAKKDFYGEGPEEEEVQQTEMMEPSADLVNLTVRWQELSFKTICDEDEWKAQFFPIRSAFTRCLHLENILIDEKEPQEEERKRNLAMTFSDGKENPYCRLSDYWEKCHHYMEGLYCIEPDPKPLEEKRKNSDLRRMVEKKIPKYVSKNPETWAYMLRPYKLMCLMAKAAYDASPFGPNGRGLWF